MSNKVSLSTRLDEWAGKDEGTHLLDFLREVFAENPDYIDALMPGMEARPRRMSTKERSQRAARVSAEVRAREAARYESVVVPAIKKILRQNRDISLRQLGKTLEAQEIYAPQGGNWAPTALTRIMKKAGLS